MGDEKNLTYTERAINLAKKFYEKLPSPNVKIVDLNLGDCKKLFGLPDDLEERVIFTSFLAFFVTSIMAFVVRSVSLFLISITLFSALGFSLLLLPKALYSIKRAETVQDTLNFFLHFITAVEHSSMERAYFEATQGLRTREFRKYWNKLLVNEVSDIPELLEKLASELRIYGDIIYTSLILLADELKKPKRNLQEVLEEITTAFRVMSEASHEVFSSKISFTSAVYVIVPFTSFLVLPVFVALIGGDINIGFIVGGAIAFICIVAASLYLFTSIPPSINFLVKDPSGAIIKEFCKNKYRFRKLYYIVGIILLLSILHPLLTILSGGLLIIVFNNRCIARYFKELRRELIELPMFLQEVSSGLLRQVPLEALLEQNGPARLFRVALRRGTVHEEFPERMFFIVDSVFRNLKDSGKVLGRTLASLRMYMSRLMEFREVSSARLDDAKSNLYIIYWVIPLSSLISIAVLKYVTGIIKQASAVGEIFGLGILKELLASEINIHIAFASTVFFTISCLLLSTLLTTVCEDIVYAKMAETKLPMLGISMIILGVGGTILMVV